MRCAPPFKTKERSERRKDDIYQPLGDATINHQNHQIIKDQDRVSTGMMMMLDAQAQQPTAKTTQRGKWQAIRAKRSQSDSAGRLPVAGVLKSIGSHSSSVPETSLSRRLNRQEALSCNRASDTMQRHRGRLLPLLMLISAAWSDGFLQPHQNQRHETCRWEKTESGQDKAKKIMYNQQSRQREAMRYQIIAVEATEPLARRMEEVGWSLCWTEHFRLSSH
jgi:hypothetical protein